MRYTFLNLMFALKIVYSCALSYLTINDKLKMHCDRYTENYLNNRIGTSSDRNINYFDSRQIKEYSEFEKLAFRINLEYLSKLDRHLVTFFRTPIGDSIVIALSKAFFIVFNKVYVKYGLQMAVLYNAFTKKNLNIGNILLLIFNIREHNRSFNYGELPFGEDSFVPVLEYFYDVYLFQGLRYFEEIFNGEFNPTDLIQNNVFETFHRYMILLKNKNLKFMTLNSVKYFQYLLKYKTNEMTVIEIIKLYLLEMFRSQEFDTLKKFLPVLNLIREEKAIKNDDTDVSKAYHKLYTMLILQLNCIEFCLFGKTNSLFLQTDIPNHKKFILKKLKFKMLFFIWDFMTHNFRKFSNELIDFVLLLCYDSFLKIFDENVSKAYFSEEDLDLCFLEYRSMVIKYEVLISFLNLRINIITMWQSNFPRSRSFR